MGDFLLTDRVAKPHFKTSFALLAHRHLSSEGNICFYKKYSVNIRTSVLRLRLTALVIYFNFINQYVLN
jgi:hypothetical protein